MLFNRGQLKPLVTVQPWSLESIGNHLRTISNSSLNGTASATYISANRAIYIPFALASTATFVKMFVINGAAVSGNIDVGIYNEAGTRLVSSGSTAQAGTSAIQEFDITDTTLSEGIYYLAVAMDNTTGTLQRGTGSSLRLQMTGMAIQASAFPLPATATFAALAASDYVPCIAATTRTLV
jgi:hypothetical protein